MISLYIDNDRYGTAPATLLLETVRNAVSDLVRSKFKESGGDWAKFVFSASDRMVTAANFKDIERRILDTGYRFGWSAVISQRERPDIYKPAQGFGVELASFSFEHPDAIVGEADATGRMQRGEGDNVVRHPQNTRGVARYIRSSEQIIDYMKRGVPVNTIAIIDDSGGTLTAPILEQFAGIICAGGTVRSHLGILAREYGIPCLMNSKISGIVAGDAVEIESCAEATSSESYFTGGATRARVWKIPSSEPASEEK
jgi:phosphohistidine swiveling domain-containing protein